MDLLESLERINGFEKNTKNEATGEAEYTIWIKALSSEITRLLFACKKEIKDLTLGFYVKLLRD